MQLVYWKAKGRAHPLRMLMAYLALSWTDVELEPASWAAEKAETKMLFPNLPYIVDNNVRLSESTAIALHVAIKAGRSDLFPVGEAGVHHLQLIGVLNDLIPKLFDAARNEEGPLVQMVIAPSIRERINQLETALAKKDWVVDKITYADFLLAYCVDMALHIPSLKNEKLLDKATGLVKHHDRVHKLKGVPEFLSKNPTAQGKYLPAHAYVKVPLMTK